MEISKERLSAAFRIADDNTKKVLHALFGKDVQTDEADNRPITERVKSYEDACKLLHKVPMLDSCELAFHTENAFGERHDCDLLDLPEHVKAYMKLCTICEALNEGWKPTYADNEYRYYPWFYFYTKEEYEALDEDDKEECRVVGRAYNNAYAYGGLAYAGSYYASSNSYTNFGSRLAFKTRELAIYCGKAFLDLWCDYLLA